MKWRCPNACAAGAAPQSGDYHGHTLARATTGGDGDLWAGWRCRWCGEQFDEPCEPDRYDPPLMEHVEVEELPTDENEVAALLLAACASTPAEMHEAGDVFGSAFDRGEDIAISTFSLVRPGDFALMAEVKAEIRSDNWVSYYAMAEALIRNGEAPQ